MSDYTLLGVDCNAFSILSHVRRIMKKEKYSNVEIYAYVKEATSKDYDYLVAISVDQIQRINDKKRRDS